MSTPRTAQALSEVLQELDLIHSEFADRVKINRSQVTRDINGERSISDSRLERYLSILKNPDHRSRVISARLVDLLGKAGKEYIIGDDVAIPGNLTTDSRRAVEWLAGEMAVDPEMAALVRRLCKTWGMEN